MARLLWLFSFIFHLFSPSYALITQCYFPNGNEAPDFPCDEDAGSSNCCGEGIGTTCLSNGLCQGPDGNVIRGSCSDASWDGCASYCLGAMTGGIDLISCANVTNDDTSYCCDHTVNCCDRGVGRFSVLPSNPAVTARWDDDRNKFVTVSAAAASSSSSSSSSSKTSSPSSTTATTSSIGAETASKSKSASASASSNSVTTTTSGTTSISIDATDIPASIPEDTSAALTSGAKAGIGIGAVVGASLIAAVLYLILRLRKTDKLLLSQHPNTQHELPSTTQQVLPTEHYQPLAVKPEQAEYYNVVPPSELDDSPRTPHELPGHNMQR